MKSDANYLEARRASHSNSPIADAQIGQGCSPEESQVVGRELARIAAAHGIALCLWLLLAASNGLGQAKPNEYQVKAAYLYNFGRFVEWPANGATAKTDSFTICILGEDPFGPALDTTLAGEMIANQKVAARRISSPQESVDCQILFISSSEANRLNKIIESLGNSAVLTVSDIPQFSQRRGMIQLVMEGNRIRFEVNLAAHSVQA